MNPYDFDDDLDRERRQDRVDRCNECRRYSCKHLDRLERAAECGTDAWVDSTFASVELVTA